ncbi:hypothetical protein COCCADRAFT_86403 [Bipolaris zeicola 26-R-13]|uniref:Uncharacterized protein n=1 Tax=Cochliobolus carbonum (strain 26-R-13) TaxID=930089 RepID=W6Z095_COCC2|nr:uncharacterized protein COCCADRAFT_86403 [Bipolaris zeicola 26-R-13]EUC37116.1 hypothetical protein COCCADRAFT_86403 [Bipolaris zeicola 26-R-13]
MRLFLAEPLSLSTCTAIHPSIPLTALSHSHGSGTTANTYLLYVLCKINNWQPTRTRSLAFRFAEAMSLGPWVVPWPTLRHCPALPALCTGRVNQALNHNTDSTRWLLGLANSIRRTADY